MGAAAGAAAVIISMPLVGAFIETGHGGEGIATPSALPGYPPAAAYAVGAAAQRRTLAGEQEVTAQLVLEHVSCRSDVSTCCMLAAVCRM